MTKSYSTTTTLVIVESPSKCKKIEEYLGPGYKCVASCGHIRELSSLNNIDVNNNFTPLYTIPDMKKKQVDTLRREINKTDDVVLATDDDREGEAIAWHICALFNLDIHKTKRIIFHEITENALRCAIQKPGRINMNIVYAQQTRQILDIIVGFKISPVLWKHIANQSLSAGRCQTPALKLVYENQLEIDKSSGKQVYNTTGLFNIGTIISFDLNKLFDSEETLLDFLEASENFVYHYSCTAPTTISKMPPSPLNTSRLQQVASNEMHISPKETMRLCQSLYEGGYITYMRTDSQNYCQEFIENISKYIIKTFDESYVGASTSQKKVSTKKKKEKKSNDEETPHEAIRPTDIFLSKLPDKFSLREQKMYKLIWETTLASCMSPATFYSIKATIKAPMAYLYTQSREKIMFSGWLSAYKKKEIDCKEYEYLLNYKKSQVINTKILSKIAIKDMKTHYTEARLVQLLEEKGIGRSSTFAMLVEKIQERGYVKKQHIQGKKVICKDYEMENNEIYEVEATREIGNERNKLVIQPLGVLVIELLEKHFSSLFDYDYTKQMETYLDLISQGDKNIIWHSKCQECLHQVNTLVDEMNIETGGRKIEFTIDDHHKYIISKNGPVIKCTIDSNVTFKPVKRDIDIQKLERGEYTLNDIMEIDTQKGIHMGTYKDKNVILKSGKYGLYVLWGEESKSLKCFGNRPLENISLEDITKILDKTGDIIHQITDNISIRNGKHGNYIFYKTPKMKKPQFMTLKSCPHDIQTSDSSILKQWIQYTYDIS